MSKKNKKKSIERYEKNRKQKTGTYALHAMFIVLAELIVGIALYFLTSFENQNIYLVIFGVMIFIPIFYYRFRVIKTFGTGRNDVLADAAFTVIWGVATFAFYGNDFAVYATTAPLLIVTIVSACAYVMQKNARKK